MELALLHVLSFFNALYLVTGNPVTPKPYRFTVYPVHRCPRNKNEFQTAAHKRNCTRSSRYLCAPNKYLSTLIEFCTDQPRKLYGKGNCVLLDGTGDLDHYSCVEKFNSSCPSEPYLDDEIYKYPACLEINKDLRCFVADRNCTERQYLIISGASYDWIPIVFIILLSLALAGMLSWILYKKRFKGKENINHDEIRLFLQKGQLIISHARGIIVGCAGAGKTTLLMRLEDRPFKELKDLKTTEIADIHENSFEVLEEKNTIRAARKKKSEESQTITFSKDDILDVKKESQTQKRQFHRERSDKIEMEDFSISKNNEVYKEDDIKLLLQSEPQNWALSQETEDDVGKHPALIKTHTDDMEIKDSGENIEMSHISESIIKKETMSGILDAIKKFTNKNRRHPRITFLDFAGQSMYYAFHQIYFSPKTFYVLVLDMSKSPDEEVNEMEDKRGSRFASWTYKDYYKFWLKSIDSFSDIKTPVIVVGTHAENKSKQECNRFFDQFFKLFEEREDLHRHLHTDRRFAIRFPDKGSELEELSEIKKCIARIVQGTSNWEETIRPACAIFEHILQGKKEEKIVSREKLSKHNKRLDTEFRLKEKEITDMLLFLHRVGSLLYFDENVLRDTVILDVQWFVNAFKCVIKDSVKIEKTTNKELNKFLETGELQDHELDAIWEKEENKDQKYSRHKQKILLYMEHFGLLAICNEEDVDSKKENANWYYFPSLNKRKIDKNLEKLKTFRSSSILCFQFDEQRQFPIFVFYALVSKCIKMSGWSILTEGNNKCIYDNVACFSFKSHIIVICICKFQIQVQVFLPKDDVCSNILREVQASVEKKIKEFQKYIYILGYKCQNGALYCEKDNSFIPLEKFPVNSRFLCDKCNLSEKHFVKNSICWLERHPPDLLDIRLKFENPKEETDEGFTSMRHILHACSDGNIENFLFHLKKEIKGRKHLLSKTDCNGWNVMHFAAKGGNLTIFQHLQSETLDVCQKTHDQMTVLHIASQSGHYDLCKYILENKDFDKNVEAKSARGKNACHYAAESGSVEIFQLLVAKGISPEETTENGQNVFHIACIYSKIKMCEYISNHYAALIHKESKEGWNATLYAAKNGHTNVLKFLNAKKVSFKHVSESNRNALHIACDNGHSEACKYIAENFSFLLNAIDHRGRYAAHFASRNGSLKVLKYLESVTDVTQETYLGMNILHMACLHENVELCSYILERYPKLNVKITENGWTTAHFVAGNGNTKGHEIEIFEMLYKAEEHVDIKVLTKQNNSVLTLAIKYNAYTFADYLFENYPSLLKIPGVNSPYDTGNEDPKMLTLLKKHLGE